MTIPTNNGGKAGAEKSVCDEKVYPKDKWGGFHPHLCGRQAVENGKCGIHCESMVKARSEKSDAAYVARRNRVMLERAAWFKQDIENLPHDLLQEIRDKINEKLGDVP